MPPKNLARRIAPTACAKVMPTPKPVRVLLVAPYSSLGGGMGRLMSYFAEHCGNTIACVLVESRGAGCKLCSALPLAKAAWTIWRHAQAPGRVIVHVNMAERGSVLRKGMLLLWASWLGLSTVLHLHAAEIMPFYNALPSLGRRAVAALFRRATMCIVLGEPWRAWLTQELLVEPHRVEILHNGVPPADFVPPTEIRGASRLVFLGNLLPRKGIADLLAALATEPLIEKQWELVVAGGGDAAFFRQQATRYGLQQKISFTGWLSRAESMALLSRASVLILPSYHEGLPLVLIEAASLGVMSITTNVGSISEVFADEQTALIVDPGDISALAEAIRRVITEPALRARIGRNARHLYEKSLSIEIFAEKLTTLYLRHCCADTATTPEFTLKRAA